MIYKKEMNKKAFEPKKYGKCGGFGFVKREPEENVKPSQITGKRKGGPS